MNYVFLLWYFKFCLLVVLLVLVVMVSVQVQQVLFLFFLGLQVVVGQVLVQIQGGVLMVMNLVNVILNWQSFFIGVQNVVCFVQLSVSSQVFNWVIGNDLFVILGSLSSNGCVWLFNFNGVLFGQGVCVDVVGLVVLILNFGNEDWFVGCYVLGSVGMLVVVVVNQGEIRIILGGCVVFVGGLVENQGFIEVLSGQVLLVVGCSVELVDMGVFNFVVKVMVLQGDVLNFGIFNVVGGCIDFYGVVVNQQGLVCVDSLVIGLVGEVVLQVSDCFMLVVGSVMSVDVVVGVGGQV